MTDIAAITHRRLSLSERLGERLGDRFRRRWKPKQTLQRVGRDDCDPRLGDRLEPLIERRRNKECPGMAGCQDDPPTNWTGAVAGAGVGTEENEAFFDCEHGRTGTVASKPNVPSPQGDRATLSGDLRGRLIAKLRQHAKGCSDVARPSIG